MFSNIGKKIKTLAVVITIIGFVTSFISGIIAMSAIKGNGGLGFLIGLGIWVVGGLSAWLGSFLLYGFGQLIDSAQNIERKVTGATDEYVPLKQRAPQANNPTNTNTNI